MTWNQKYEKVEENYDCGFVLLIITRDFRRTNELVVAAHLVYLHVYDFVVFAQTFEKYDVNKHPQNCNFHNPPRRDVALLFITTAFKPNSPGGWLLHCLIGEMSFHLTSVLKQGLF